jgi:hypothetical protein
VKAHPGREETVGVEANPEGGGRRYSTGRDSPQKCGEAVAVEAHHGCGEAVDVEPRPGSREALDAEAQPGSLWRWGGCRSEGSPFTPELRRLTKEICMPLTMLCKLLWSIF